MKKRLLCLSLIFAMTAAQVMPVSAARKDDLQAEKSATQSKLSAAESKANSLESQKQKLMGQIDSTQQELVSVISQIEILDEDIKEKETDIEKTKEDLAKAEADRDEQYEAMKLRIQYMYENGGNDTWAKILLESDSIASMLAKAENTEKMYAYDRDELQKMKEIVQEVTDLEEKLEGEKAELETAKNEQEGMKDSLQVKVDNLKANAKDYEAQIASAKAQAQEYKNLIAQQNAELKKIQQQEAAAAKAAQEAAKKKQEQQNNSGNNGGNAVTGGTVSNNNNAGTNNNDGGSSDNNSGNTNNNSNNNNNNDVDTNTDTTPESNTGNTGGGSTQVETPSAPSYNSATGEAVVSYAMQFIGNPYVYGGNSLTNGIDCSGFTQQIFGHFGYSLPRTSDAQAGSGVGISYSESRAGDIIVYPGHVAILTGDGGIVHASNSAPYPKGGIKYTANALYRNYIAIRRIVQ
ncbi:MULTISPECIES: C40 family peptidase [Blautia]|uniref:C40 family peptidase n=1 Tax=Blautia TaxID=572511 RepID=UPI002589D985|nr:MULTISPECIES: C40 family peptidase [Blautia]